MTSPAWFIYSRPESRDHWWVTVGSQKEDDPDCWIDFSHVGDAHDLLSAQLLVPDLKNRTLHWKTDDPRRVSREIWT